jgi:hypothetical protein
MEGASGSNSAEAERSPEQPWATERRPLIVRAETLPDEEEVLFPPAHAEPREESEPEPAPSAQAESAPAADEPAAPVKQRVRRLWWRKRTQRPRGSGGDAPTGEEG